jgi:iron complex transport system substrate-binding protein
MRAAVLGLAAVLLAGCGREPAQPARARIVSVAPNLTEMLFAAGAADQVVGVSAFSDYPQEAQALPQVGDAFRLDYERIVALAPTAAVVWETGTPAGVAERLEGLGIRVVSIPTRRLDDIAAGVLELGALAGSRQVAETAARDFRGRVAALRERYRGRPPVRVFVQIDDAPLFTVGGPHLITEILALCGGVNVFGDARDQALPVDLEAVLARAPEVILSTDDGDPVPFWSRFAGLPAVARGHVFRAPADALARPSPRIVEGAASVCETLDAARSRSARPASG